jgi:hypothetical protein
MLSRTELEALLWDSSALGLAYYGTVCHFYLSQTDISRVDLNVEMTSSEMSEITGTIFYEV